MIKITFMFKIFLISCIMVLSSVTKQCVNKSNSVNSNAMSGNPSIHQYKVQSLEGGTIDFSAYKGKKILVVNTASKCGYTPQYEALEKLYKEHQDKLVIVGFPANNFGGQEPGSDLEIKEFCTKNYGVTFPMASKVSVKGDDIAPVFKWLTTKSLNGKLDADIKWNFTKFLIDENGELLAEFDSKVLPGGEEIQKYL